MKRDEGGDNDHDEPTTTAAYMRIKLNDISVNMSFPLRDTPLEHIYRPPLPNTSTSFPPGAIPTKVPVIRIFGRTSKNQSVCLNVHGIWPYFFVDYPSGRSLAPDSVHRYTHRLAIALNSALCQSLRQDQYSTMSKTGPGGLNTSTLHVASVMLCKGIPFYGYHVGYSYYLKIALVTPSHIYRAVNLLEGGGVMKNKFNVYESHLATKLQFMVDFDLYGCGWVDIESAMFRSPLPGTLRRCLGD
jgi:DNA polymerase zeta